MLYSINNKNLWELKLSSHNEATTMLNCVYISKLILVFSKLIKCLFNILPIFVLLINKFCKFLTN